MASTIAAVEKMGFRVGEIGVRRDLFELLREAQLLRIKLKELEEQSIRWGKGFQSLILKYRIRTFLPFNQDHKTKL